MELIPRRIYITDPDRQHLMTLLPAKGPLLGAHVRTLRAGLEAAAVVPPEQVPPDVVALGRRFRIRDLETGTTAEYKLVLPKEADLARGHISVLAPIGASLLGAQAQETITFSTPLSTRRFQIESVWSRAEPSGDGGAGSTGVRPGAG